ncbi:MAG TPA: hypothetical protein VGB06_09540 [Solirubrobacterales bacterium]|jgi:hypothetical protein
MTRRLLFLVAAVGAALAIAGCGGGDDGDETTAPAPSPPVETTALSKEELLAQGDAICAEVNAAVGALASSEAGGESAEAAELYGGMAERLKDLGAPSDDPTGYSEVMTAVEALSQAESDVALAAERGDEEGLVSAEAEASSALSSFQEEASDYGFEQCGEGPSAVSSPATGGAPAETEVESETSEEVEEVEEEAPEEVEEVTPEPEGGGAGAGGGAEAGGETGGGETGGSSGGIGPG